MTPETETPLSHLDLIKILKAEILAEIATRTSPPRDDASQPQKEQIGGRQCHLHALRDETTGQFYALTDEDRAAMNKHFEGIVADLDPQNHRERWLATAIAEDQWRLNRARALENNIFAIGMSGALTEATNADSPEVLAAVCQARVWLADGKHLQALSLYEQRIRRSIEKNEKQLEQTPGSTQSRACSGVRRRGSHRRVRSQQRRNLRSQTPKMASNFQPPKSSASPAAESACNRPSITKNKP